MKTIKKTVLFLTVLLLGIPLTVWWSHRPTRITQAFVGHLSNERYDEAEMMLRGPSKISVAADGGLIIVDHAGNSTAVPEARLPFLVGGGNRDGSKDFSMTALQGSANGLLNPPAVTIYLSIKDGKIQVDNVES